MHSAVLLAMHDTNQLAKLYSIVQPWLLSLCTSLGSTPHAAVSLRTLGLATRVLEQAMPHRPPLISREQLGTMYELICCAMTFYCFSALLCMQQACLSNKSCITTCN